MDGSCLRPGRRGTARGGWAAVQIDEQGKVLASGQGTLVGRQLAIEGEHKAMNEAMVAAEHGLTIQRDCAAVATANRKPYAVAAGARTRFSGKRRQRCKQLGARANKHGIEKTKAHRTKKEVEGLSKEEQQRWAGNGKSDELAKAVVEWHVTPADESEGRAKQTLWRCRVVQSIGNFLAVLPNAHVLYADHQEDDGAAEMDVVGINREHEQEEEDVFGFGLSIENFGEGPEGHEQSGLMDVGD